MINQEAFIEKITATAYKIPTDYFESDGTFEWDHTTMVIVVIQTQGQQGIGFTYGDASVAELINNTFAPILTGTNAMNIPWIWEKIVHQIRNVGWRGIAATAISAIDIALWDLKAKLLDIPLCFLFGMIQRDVPVYGSGGFISYPDWKLQEQLEGWKKEGITKFKIKIGRDAKTDLERIKQARDIIGPDADLYVDANGAYKPQEALAMAESFRPFHVTWFEEPVSSDDLEGLKFLRSRVPPGMNITTGEYGYELFYFRQVLEAQAVDVLQVDATRCGGFTGFFQAASLSYAHNIPVSSHMAPSIHLHACLSLPHLCHMEYFHDHARVEKIFFDGAPEVKEGRLYPKLDSPGLGLVLKEKEIEAFSLTPRVLAL